MSRPGHLLFLHIPKTAGTTLHNVLSRHYPKQQQLELNMFTDKNRVETFSEAELSTARLVRGHFPFGFHVLLGERPFEYVTLLREPVDRCVSHYYYVLNRRNQQHRPGTKPLVSSLAELCENGDALFVDNMQVRFLSGNMEIPFDTVTEQMLHDAKDNLDRYFPLIGVQEEFDAFLLLLAERYQFRLPYYRSRRVSTSRKNVTELDAETRTALEKRNHLDIQLYAYAKEKVDALLAARGASFQQQLQKFRKRNARVTKLLNLIPFFPKGKSGAD